MIESEMRYKLDQRDWSREDIERMIECESSCLKCGGCCKGKCPTLVAEPIEVCARCCKNTCLSARACAEAGNDEYAPNDYKAKIKEMVKFQEVFYSRLSTDRGYTVDIKIDPDGKHREEVPITQLASWLEEDLPMRAGIFLSACEGHLSDHPALLVQKR